MTTDQLARVREICLALPGATERISHGEATFFVRDKVFVMFANNHHGDGRIAVWLPVPAGMRQGIIDAAPHVFFKPPYVGTRGWVGIVLDQIGDAELASHVGLAWDLVRRKR